MRFPASWIWIFPGLVHAIRENEHSRIFVFDDWHSKQNFFKQFFSGIFITIVMTGLDQDMMQKNLSCKNLREAQKNMYCYGISFVPVNFPVPVTRNPAVIVRLATEHPPAGSRG